MTVGAHDAMTAQLIESHGFDAVWVSGFGVSTMAHAMPDLNVVTMTEALAAAMRIAEATSLPVVADCDNGFGGRQWHVPQLGGRPDGLLYAQERTVHPACRPQRDQRESLDVRRGDQRAGHLGSRHRASHVGKWIGHGHECGGNLRDPGLVGRYRQYRDRPLPRLRGGSCGSRRARETHAVPAALLPGSSHL